MNPMTRNSRLSGIQQASSGIVSLCLIFLATGCTESVSPDVQAHRQRLILPAAPSDETPVANVREQLMAEDAPAEIPVVIRGRIHAGETQPWENGKAAFALTDATGHDGDTDHDPWTCPFCSRKIEDYIVNVYFRDDAGKVIGIDSRELFPVTERQLVIIEGIGSVNEDNTLIVNATGMHLVQ